MKNSQSKGRRALLVLIVIVLVCAVAVSCAACSLFVSAFGVNVNGFSRKVTATDADKQEGSSSEGGQSSDDSGTHFVDLNDDEDDADTGDGSEEQQETPTDPEVNEPEKESENVTITSSLIYDKSSGENMRITATHPNKSLSAEGLLGAGLTQSRYYMRSNSVGASTVEILKSYLNTLDVGSYVFYYTVQDSSNVYYEPFTLEITNSHCAPTDLKIDYDINCKGEGSDVYVTWKCDCNKKHKLAFDGTRYTAPAGDRSFKIPASNVDKTTAHYAQVQCGDDSATELCITKAAPARSVVNGDYLKNTFSFMGKVADRYVEDFDEMVFAYQYLAYEETDAELTVALGPDVLSEIGSNLQTYLQKVNAELVVPWSFKIGFSSLDNIATLSVQEVVGGNSISSGYASSVTYDRTAPTSHYSDQGGSRTTFPIDGKTAVPVRNTKELLAVVEAGYKPSISDEALTMLYNKARLVCSRYITDDMSDVEKLHVIYDYLAGEIVYDDSTLQLYSLINEISKKSLAEAKEYVAENIDTLRFSASMRAVVENACNAAGNTEELYTMLYNNYLQKLNAFSIEGVFNDGTAVCEGISYAFMLLARIEGIECYQVSGKAVQNGSKVNHAWNKVILDGTCYCVDATWGNISVFANKRFVSHRYFLLDEASFYSSHVEEISQDVKGISVLATGNYEYYKSFSIDEHEHTLYVSDKDDLSAVARYYADADSLYLEMQIDSEYTKDSDVMSVLHDAYSNATMVFDSVSTSYSENGVCMMYVTLRSRS